jgi:hypothetical protein
LDLRRALDILGLDEDVDLTRLKQRFRALARDRHPDRGGDPALFQDLHSAYELLRGTLTDTPSRPLPPRVARGRPSRSEDGARIALSLDDAALSPAARTFTDRLVEHGSCSSLSRAPGSRLNRVAASLALGTVSRLDARLLPPPASDAPRTVQVELTARSRAARRALAALDLSAVEGPAWTRRRSDGITVLEASVAASDTQAAARRAAAALSGLLDALDWPLDAWRAA